MRSTFCAWEHLCLEGHGLVVLFSATENGRSALLVLLPAVCCSDGRASSTKAGGLHGVQTPSITANNHKAPSPLMTNTSTDVNPPGLPRLFSRSRCGSLFAQLLCSALQGRSETKVLRGCLLVKAMEVSFCKSFFAI